MKKLLIILAAVFGTLVAGALIAAVLVWNYLSADLPDYSQLENYKPPITTRVHAGDGALIGEFARERRLFVPVEDIPERVRHAFLSAEDKNFYIHPGIDMLGVVRAAIENVSNYMQGRRLEGASTITQQVAKNFLLSGEVSLERKLKEAVLAFKIESAFTKDEIFELYLNEIYLGTGSYGVAAAALNYFDKSLDELTLAEAAYFAALPKAPNNYHPIRARERAIARRNWVLEQMVENGWATRAEAETAKAEPIEPRFRPVGAQNPESEYFVEEVRRIVYQRYGENALYDGGLSVRATLDPVLQRYATRALRDGLIAYDMRHGWRGPFAKIEPGEGWEARLKAVARPGDIPEWRLAVVLETAREGAEIGFEDGTRGFMPFETMAWARPWIDDRRTGPAPQAPADVAAAGDVVFVQQMEVETAAIGGAAAARFALRQLPEVNGALVALDPHTGRVLALAGGFSFYGSEFNRATQALRQTGSAFKPFIYAAALDHGFTPVTRVMDGPIAIDQGPGLPLWRPENYSNDFLGPTTLRRGLEKSRNLMTVRLAQQVGMDVIADYARRFGIIDNLPPFLSMSLGAGETTLIKLTAAFGTIVNGGKKVQPILIDRVQDRHGKTMFRADPRTCPECAPGPWAAQEEPALPDPRERVLDERTAYQMVSILEGVVLRGTATSVRAVGVPLGGKTGTTNEERDAWFVGFSPDLVAGIYVGFDQPRAMGKGETGGRIAAPIFRDFMARAVGGKPAVPFRTPPGITFVRVDAASGRPVSGAGGILEAFKTGEERTAFLQRGVVGADGSYVGSDAESTEGAGVGVGTGGLY